jgi:hypothetical protein
MKLLLISLLVLATTANAQVPSFRSFNTNKFTTNNFQIGLNDPLVITNLISSNIFTTNLYTTNLYVTNIFNDIRFNGRVTFNTNVTFVTNVVNSISDPTQSFAPVGGVLGIIYTNIFLTNLTAGVRDIFTVPTGYFSVGVSIFPFNSTNGSSVGYSPFLNQSGNYRRLASSIGILTNTVGAASLSGLARIMTSGDVLAVSNTINGLSLAVTWKLFPDTTPFVSARLFGLTTSPQLLYQCPTNTISHPVSINNITVSEFAPLVFGNDSGSTRLYKVYVVPPGYSPNESTLLMQSTATTSSVGLFTLPILHEGFAVYVESDSAGEYQWAHTQYFEFAE